MVVVKLLQRSLILLDKKTTEYGKSCHKFVKKNLTAIVFFCKINSHSHSILEMLHFYNYYSMHALSDNFARTAAHDSVHLYSIDSVFL